MKKKLTVFQKILRGKKLKNKLEYNDEICFVIHDINPKAPIHLLIIPKIPIPRISKIQESHKALVGHLLFVAKKMADRFCRNNKNKKIVKNINQIKNYRIIINNGIEAGETIPHLHIHLMGGRKFGWPPG
jgi:histidine triad (HIT) family protein